MIREKHYQCLITFLVRSPTSQIGNNKAQNSTPLVGANLRNRATQRLFRVVSGTEKLVRLLKEEMEESSSLLPSALVSGDVSTQSSDGSLNAASDASLVGMEAGRDNCCVPLSP